MNFEEFEAWLSRELNEGHLGEGQVRDALQQRRLFDGDRTFLESEFRMRLVGYVNGQRQTDFQDIGALLRFANTRFPGQMVYFERIGCRVF